MDSEPPTSSKAVLSPPIHSVHQPPTTESSVTDLTDDLTATPNQQPTPVGTTSNSLHELPASAINKGALRPADEVLSKCKYLQFESKVGALAVKLAKETYFGDNVMMQCTPQ